ncbi:MAG: Glycosyl transferase group 1 [candidate division TM6 bacterium GW2011_GWF2_37_49]|nr:MAG: Glycosyl transferase group 1 [candidate division TM6 bacterium GW2011_GWF2_37_49]
MRVGFYFGRNVASGDSSGGANTFRSSLLNAMKSYQGRCKYYVFSEDYSSDEFDTKFIKIDTGLGFENECFFKKQLLRIPRKIKRMNLETKYKNALNRAAVEHKIDLMWFITPAFEVVEVPFVYTVWDLEHRCQSFFPEVSVTAWKYDDREKRYCYAIPRAAYVVIGNQAGKDEVIKFYGVPEQRVKIIPLPAPEFALKDQSDLSVNLSVYNLPDKFLFYPAQVWPHKNHIVILLALKILKEKFEIKMHAVFTGSDKGNLSFVQQKVAELNLVDQVHFLNVVPFNVLSELYKKAFALVFPSFFGPDNIPPLEAFGLGCPVIAASVNGSAFQLGDAAILFDPKNENELADAIFKLINYEELRKMLILRGKERVKFFTIDKYLQSVTNLIDEFELVRRCWAPGSEYTAK